MRLLCVLLSAMEWMPPGSRQSLSPGGEGGGWKGKRARCSLHLRHWCRRWGERHFPRPRPKRQPFLCRGCSSLWTRLAAKPLPCCRKESPACQTLFLRRLEKISLVFLNWMDDEMYSGLCFQAGNLVSATSSVRCPTHPEPKNSN